MYAEVFLNEATLAFDQLYTYRVPLPLESLLRPGMRVIVPFGKGDREREAMVRRLLPESQDLDPDIPYKQILRSIDEAPVLYEDQLELAEQMRIRYTCTYGEAVRLMLPPGAGTSVHSRQERTARLTDLEEAVELLNSGSVDYVNQVHVLEFLLTYGESATTDIQAACQVSPSTLTTLKKKGWIEFGQREAEIPLEESPPEPEEPPVPTEGQAAALASLREALRGGDQRSIREFLLRGITGSGKTEVYLQLCQAVLEMGKTAIILVPEISLTPQMTDRFRRRFGSKVAVMHSRLTLRQRYDQWLLILRQEVSLVVGARSAIFSPLQNLGLIVIDEEQENTYHSEMKPRYHARTVARLRIRDRNALLLLGSATPDVESYYRTTIGRSRLLELPERPGEAKLPESRIIDMREEIKAGNRSIFSAELKAEMEAAFSRGEQVMLFLNRRGYAGIWLCQDCGKSIYCPHCSVPMTYHLSYRTRPDSLQCHYCGRIESPPHICPNCRSRNIGAYGLGTEQAEERFKEEFPGRTILRMDQDTTIGRGSHYEIVHAFHEHEADVLLGTQMIAKGHDFPLLTVVGILAADQLLLQNDFRARERAFQLITQAAGRAGRANLPGKVFIQAFDIDDYVLHQALEQDYPAFYREEIRFREAMQYPPFASMGTVMASGPRDSEAKNAADEARAAVLRFAGRSVPPVDLDPTSISRSRIARLNNRYRWQFTIKSRSAKTIADSFALISGLKVDPEVRISLELDPA